MSGNIRLKVKKQVKKAAVDLGLLKDEGIAVRSFKALKSSDAMNEVAEYVKGFDRDHIWSFSSGQSSQDFRGNPKYLFVYINRYRPDIRAYWLCEEEKTIQQIRSLGFKAYSIQSPEGQYLINRTGVVVAEQVKQAMPSGFHNVKYINLWHGVGFKKVERSLFKGDLAMPLARKYVQRGSFYRDHQLVGVTSPTNEQEFTTDLGTDKDYFMRAGYLRCEYQQNYDPIISYEHDLRKVKGLPESTKLVVYAPTYRAHLEGTFTKSIPDFEILYRYCEKNNILFIFKVHPNMEKEVGFLNAWQTYGNRKHFWFWDNQNDFYEIMDQIDLAIVDYSAIFSDMIAVGIRHFIRYVFDYDDYMNSVSVYNNYMDKTTGKLCYSFNELLEALTTFEERDETEAIERLKGELWPYAQGKDDFDRVIQMTFDFEVRDRNHPTLYSFDVFDTLISRKVLNPEGIFFYVQEQIELDGTFPVALQRKYPFIRKTTEASVRETSYKTTLERDSEWVEITLDQILERIANVYTLSEDQMNKLKNWEITAERENVIPLKEQIELVRSLVESNETVVLISDMYLSRDVIHELLVSADPMLGTLPLFLSSEYGVLKNSQKLYFEVYKSFQPYYDFKKWIHYGDNERADELAARRFHIQTRKIQKTEINSIEDSLVKNLATYDGYKVAALQARIRKKNQYDMDSLVISFLSLCFVPYIDWVLRDAEKRKYETLYFVSRDGHHLKRIADAMIRQRGLAFKTKYIYASRRTWRIPSFITEIDPGFWQGYGSFGDVATKEKLLGALHITEEKFKEVFPEVKLDGINFNDRAEFRGLMEIFKNSSRYERYLLDIAARERKVVNAYLLQEINPDENFAIVEYYGRGYSQDCLNRLWREAIHDPEASVPFYYSRSVVPSMNGTIRHHFTTNNGRQYFIEAIFANMPYKSIEAYYLDGEVYKPEIVPIPCDQVLYESMNRLLPEIAEGYAGLELSHPEDTDRMLYDFVFDYFEENKTSLEFAQQFGRLKDSVTLYGNKREFAPPYTMELLDKFEEKTLSRGMMRVTSDIRMSYTRTPEKVRARYDEMFQVLPGEDCVDSKMLTEAERSENQTYHSMLQELNETSSRLEKLYTDAARTAETDGHILIIVPEDSQQEYGISRLSTILSKKGCAVTVWKKASSPTQKFALELATASYVITYEPLPILNSISFKEQTKHIILQRTPFRLQNDAMATELFLKWKQAYMRTAGRNDAAVIQIPSKGVEDYYRECYATKEQIKMDLYGCCSTDQYFEPGMSQKAKQKLYSYFPEAKEKKVILYMPSWRSREDYDNWGELLDMELLRDRIGEEYVVAVHLINSQIKNKYYNTIDVAGFSRNLSGKMWLRDLIMASDVIIGDYRDVFFEAALIHKPMYSTAFDYERQIRVKNMSLNANRFEQMLFCPIVEDADALANELAVIDQYDYAPLERFVSTFMKACDGNSVKKVAKYILKDMIQSHSDRDDQSL